MPGCDDPLFSVLVQQRWRADVRTDRRERRFVLSLFCAFIFLCREKGVCKREIAAILTRLDLNLHDPNRVIKVLNHLAGLLCINSMSLVIVHLGLQFIELPPDFSVTQIAVMGNQMGTICADPSVVRANADTCTTEPKDCWPNHPDLFKFLAQHLVYLL